MIESPPSLPSQTDLWQSTLQWVPTPIQQELLQQLYQGVLEGNQVLNLTRITAPEEFWEKHVWDSFSGLQGYLTQTTPPPTRIIDIGTGGGFPGLPAAIAFPESTITLLDATRKKIAFLETLAHSLGLTNVIPITERAEALGQHPTHREQYDLALLRAVAPANVCAEYALPLLKQGGRAILYRGQWTPEEEQELEGAIAQLGGQLFRVDALTTPLSQSLRHCIHLDKVAPTPERFPRGVGIPRQRPL
ncbi:MULTISPECIES: 16S rRNA (guanine(527)-N(7))-methyltransferase RsmG [unclassified Leptolyngbya]|uniref:16S rRNA (guanine(527)-N(7))-methyltransferase RsmG n=1 Tax=unclassified Leptolyngbya TaxID=2650499 RepID=UPI0016836C37|nr:MULTISPECIES: 16S rRNA (guanine(527)-N(7))-methyltransferase RsmG [unclassified Leptolyngbya]MBD1911651.1 16S rRNA (guanine(527)-N(7))-methyltransferase RsmG [Leptolyngbya sp. FACHB-8]MBD2154610.1 16S rRNA (guanine(527)-N(7))-methyltransferase RsmG [Leptolyngbya sp. FACHB-16]